ncbi:MAG: hypothetical protein ACR2HY_00275 [Acidimicrobiales bacterium]
MAVTSENRNPSPSPSKPVDTDILVGALRLAEWTVAQLAGGITSALHWARLRLYALHVAADPRTRAWIEQADQDAATEESARRAPIREELLARIVAERQAADEERLNTG